MWNWIFIKTFPLCSCYILSHIPKCVASGLTLLNTFMSSPSRGLRCALLALAVTLNWGGRRGKHGVLGHSCYWGHLDKLEQRGHVWERQMFSPWLLPSAACWGIRKKVKPSSCREVSCERTSQQEQVAAGRPSWAPGWMLWAPGAGPGVPPSHTRSWWQIWWERVAWLRGCWSGDLCTCCPACVGLCVQHTPGHSCPRQRGRLEGTGPGRRWRREKLDVWELVSVPGLPKEPRSLSWMWHPHSMKVLVAVLINGVCALLYLTIAA